MQGKDIFPDGLPCAVRITPACAGKSRSQPRLPCTGRDHPRVCGEKLRIVEVGRVKEGSPPRVRGKGRSKRFRCTSPWITPAYAGKSSAAAAARICAMDHPRVCREKTVSSKKISNLQGSPPRMRGKGNGIQERHDDPGITPACAGKRTSFTGIQIPVKDHPRVCGEKTMRFIIASTVSGSPPRMRGKGNFHVVTHTKVGITPAYARKRKWHPRTA